MKNSKTLKKLKRLERENRYVFHGSGVRLPELEPRQAYTWTSGEKVADDFPAVFASELVDYAIFMALISSCKKPFRASCDFSYNKLRFGASDGTLEQLKNRSSGYVYVFLRDKFEHRGGCEWRARTAVSPVDIVEIRYVDFKPRIEIIEHRIVPNEEELSATES